ncbi:FAD dependent oxidoreductase-domain-containing protein [Kalaharituber pfeilii]|nr:FAD dependent oxidoreductase-domain-containing protein [Kalaharituber pfeilii]
MGIIFSLLRDIRLLYKTVSSLNSSFTVLLARLSADPGLPRSNPTQAYWQCPPHRLSDVQTPSELPESADIVVIGSGITAAAAARTILTTTPSATRKLKVIVLEARALCSGATGRNGGHIKTSPYLEYKCLESRYGKESTARILEFRRRHLYELGKVAAEEGALKESEFREVETVDAYFDEGAWRKAKENLHHYIRDYGVKENNENGDEWKYKIWEGEQARERFSIRRAIGCITYPAGTLSSYTFVTKIWENLVGRYPWSGGDISSNHAFSIQTFTPCLEVTQDPSNGTYKISTPRGDIVTNHVLHVTNSHVAHLLPQFRGKVFPVRGQMTAQIPPFDFPSPYPVSTDARLQPRSWSFIYPKGFDYLTIRPPDPANPNSDRGILMFGGGLVQATGEGMSEFGLAEDGYDLKNGEPGGPNIVIAGYLSGLIGYLFGSSDHVLQSGTERTKRIAQGAVLSHWTGVMGWSADMLPFVGLLPSKTFPKRCGAADSENAGKEWVAAGYSGEGMVNAWGCGTALGIMVRDDILGLGKANSENQVEPNHGVSPRRTVQTGFHADGLGWFPKEYLFTEGRIQQADVKKMIEWLYML